MELLLKEYSFNIQILLTSLFLFAKLVISNKTDIVTGSLRERKNILKTSEIT